MDFNLALFLFFAGWFALHMILEIFFEDSIEVGALVYVAYLVVGVLFIMNVAGVI